jgi:F0F1-type ATP synthase membrane subunit c/vacuolar-type H+-ATPase subunit K
MKTKNLQVLTIKEMQDINGGYNLIEYIAMGLGYVAGAISSGSSFQTAAEANSKYPIGPNKW